MLSIVQSNKEAVLEKIRLGPQIGGRNFVETIIKKMLERGILDELSPVVKDKRTAGPFLEAESGFQRKYPTSTGILTPLPRRWRSFRGGVGR